MQPNAKPLAPWCVGALPISRRKRACREATIESLEAEEFVDPAAMEKIEAAFKTMGVDFTFGDRPGVRFRTLDGIIEVSAGPIAKPH